MKKARLITTFECKRNCAYCCNGYAICRTWMEPLQGGLHALEDYDEIMITGGEPMLDVARTLQIIKLIRAINPDAKIYLYSAWYKYENQWLFSVADYIDGVHFTVHTGASQQDLIDFASFQSDAWFLKHNAHPNLSFRAYISPEINGHFNITPNIWTRFEIKPWLTEKEIPRSEDKLFYMGKLPNG